MRALYWFREDLRLQDNPALQACCEAADEVVFAFVVPSGKNWSRSKERAGHHRRHFMWESLFALNESLEAHGNTLFVLEGDPVECISNWARECNCEQVFSQACHSHEEEEAANRIAELLPHTCIEGNTLIHPSDLPFEISDLPEVFSRFRNRVEKGGLKVRVVQNDTKIPGLPSSIPRGKVLLVPRRKQAVSGKFLQFQGGESAGWKRLNHYFDTTRGLSTYKQTRNGLLGWDYSSKFSPWLAWGCLSSRSIYHAIRRYEEKFGANDSTYWLIFELLWRDYFRFVSMQNGRNMWRSFGLKPDAPRIANHDEGRFQSWCAGLTKNDFVNANMHELRLTGFMSNRGRQNAASYAVHDLGLDWRICAAWFEYQLIDFDPCSNTGNWLYVAGIGNDPRPQRKFDVEWQASQYDPGGDFTRFWIEQGQDFPLESGGE